MIHLQYSLAQNSFSSAQPDEVGNQQLGRLRLAGTRLSTSHKSGTRREREKTRGSKQERTTTVNIQKVVGGVKTL